MSFKLTLVQTLGLLFAVFSGASAVSIGTHYWLLTRTTGDIDLIDAVAQLRMRTSRIHWILNRAHLETGDLEYMRTALPRIREAVHALQTGGPAFDRQIPAIASEFSGDVEALKRKWSAIESDLASLAALQDPRAADGPPHARLHPQINEFESQVTRLQRVLESRRASLRQTMLRVIVVLSAATVLLLLAGAVTIARRVVVPIRLLTTGNQAMQNGNFSYRVPVSFDDELGSLSKAFNETAETIQRFISDKEAILKQLTSAVQGLENEVEERRTVEERLRRSEARLEEAQRIAHVGNWEVDLVADKLFWSDEVYRIYGLQPRRGPEQRALFWDAVHPEELERVRAASNTARTTVRPYSIEHRIIRPDGTIRFVHENAEIVAGEDQLGIRMVGTVQDITEQRQIEEQFRQLLKMEAIGRLAGGVAHDFNNLLTVIGGYAEMLVSSEIDASTRNGLQEIVQSSERASALTHQLLAFSRQQVLQPRVLQLNLVVHNMESMLRRLIGEQFTLRSVLDPKLWPVSADKSQLEQVIMNLVVNARDAMPGGGAITIETNNVSLNEAYVSTRVALQPGDYISMTVSDSGQGMDETTKTRIFEPFFTTKERGRGTGLGLSTVYGIIKQSGGDILVRSELGRGTSMRVYLPSAGADSKIVPDLQFLEKPEHRSGTILVVEDDHGVRRLVRAILEDCGYTVVDTDSGQEALRMLDGDHLRIDLLISDLIMPGMDGLQLHEEVCRRVLGIRTLFMSGYSEHTITLAPGVFFVSKPFTPSGLAQKVSEVLQHPAAV